MPLITFQLELWQRYYQDCQALWQEHYDEIAVDKVLMPMGPDTHVYEQLEREGALQILTCRADSVMVGYFLSVVRPHMHYRKVLCGFEDSYFLSRGYRKGLTGVRLLKENERHLAARGVKKVFVMTKTFKDLSRIYERMGYTPCDIVLSKWLNTGLDSNLPEGVL